MNNQLIVKTINSGNSQSIVDLLNQFLDRGDLLSCRELLTEIMLQQDIDDVYKPNGEQFLRDVLSGDRWTGYSHISFAEIVQEFSNRELFTDYLNLDIDSESLFLDRLLALVD